MLLGEGIEAVGEGLEDVSTQAAFVGGGEEPPGLVDAAPVEGPGEVEDHLPVGDAVVGAGVVVVGEVGGGDEADAAAAGGEDAGAFEGVDGGVAGGGEGLGLPVGALGEAVGVEPGEAPAGVGVEVALLLAEDLVEHGVDLGEGLGDAHVGAVGADDAGVAGEDAHAGADGRLGEVDGGDAAAAQGLDGLGEGAAQLAHEAAAVGHGGVLGTGPQHEDDGGGQGVGSGGHHAVPQLGAHGPGGGDAPAGADHALEDRGPARGCPSIDAGLRLLEGVVDRHRVVRVGAPTGVGEDGAEAVLEEVPRPVPAAVTVLVGDQLLGLGDEHGGEEGGVDVLEGASQPDVEEVGEVGVADIVVVRRIC